MVRIATYFITIVSILIVQLSSLAQGLVINEVQYQNKTTLTDSDGDTPDWIEIYNAGNKPIDLSGYSLTDDEDFEESWALPKLNIAPGEYLIIFASSKNRIADNEYHTNFKLRLMAEPLFLLNSDREVVDEVPIQCIPPDKSLGYVNDGSGERAVMTPTPATSNSTAKLIQIDYKADTLMASHQSGFYKGEIKLSLSNKHSSNSIVYTLNSKNPDFDETEYSSPITLEDISGNENRFADKGGYAFEPGNLISKANILRAMVYSEGCPASNEISGAYFIGEKTFDYNVPIVSMITDKDNLFDDDIGIHIIGNHNNQNQHGKAWERPISLEIYDKEKTKIISQHAGVRLHGRASRNGNMKSFRLYAREKYGKDTFQYPFFSQKNHLNSFKTLILKRSRGWYNTLFSDDLCQRIVAGMNVDYTAVETVILFLNGEYWGIYSLRERHDEHYIKNNYGIENTEIDVIGYDIKNTLVESGNKENYDALWHFLESTDPNDEQFYEEASKLIDLDESMDYYIAQVFLANQDFPNNNQELWRPQGEGYKWRHFFFDMDGAMTRIDYNLLPELNDDQSNFSRFDAYSSFIIRKLLQNRRFNKEFYVRFNHHLNTTFAPDRLLKQVERYEKLYKPLAAEHIYRWQLPSDYVKWLHNVDIHRLFALQRPLVVQQLLAKQFGLPFSCYPNPSSGEFKVDFFDDNVNKKLEILNTNGNTVYGSTIQEGVTPTISTNLPTGNYFLKVLIGQHSYSQPIIIVK